MVTDREQMNHIAFKQIQRRIVLPKTFALVAADQPGMLTQHMKAYLRPHVLDHPRFGVMLHQNGRRIGGHPSPREA